jgi:hypothetical protein
MAGPQGQVRCHTHVSRATVHRKKHLDIRWTFGEPGQSSDIWSRGQKMIAPPTVQCADNAASARKTCTHRNVPLGETARCCPVIDTKCTVGVVVRAADRGVGSELLDYYAVQRTGCWYQHRCRRPRRAASSATAGPGRCEHRRARGPHRAPMSREPTCRRRPSASRP